MELLLIFKFVHPQFELDAKSQDPQFFEKSECCPEMPFSLQSSLSSQMCFRNQDLRLDLLAQVSSHESLVSLHALKGF